MYIFKLTLSLVCVAMLSLSCSQSGDDTGDTDTGPADNGIYSTDTGADSVDTGADSVDTGADSVDTGADSVDTGIDSVDTGADSVDTGADSVDTDSTYTVPNGWLRVDGRVIRDSNDNEVALRGVSIVDISEQTRNNGGIPAAVDAMVDNGAGWNAKVVRLPVYPEDDDEFQSAPMKWSKSNAQTYFSTYLEPAVNYALSKGLFVIIDLHYIEDSSTRTQLPLDFWTDVAPRYKDEPRVLFELFNEPTETGTGIYVWQSFAERAQVWIDAIRKVAPYNLILAGAPQWSQLVGPSAFFPLAGGNIVYVAHIYDFHIEADGSSLIFDNMALANDYHPLFVTEWGFFGNNTKEGNYIKTFLNEHNLSWTAWCFDENWGPPMFNNNFTNTNAFGDFVKTFLDETKTSNQPTL